MSKSNVILTDRRGCRGRRGSVYILALGLAVVLTVIGLGVIAAERISARTTAQAADTMRAEMLAFSGAEHALRQIKENPDWREDYDGRNFQHTINEGTFTWSVADSDDGDLGDSPTDPAIITATGGYGQARYTVALRVVVRGQAMSVLGNSVVSGQETFIRPFKNLTLEGAKLKSNERVKNHGTINGDVVAPEIMGRGNHDGEFTADDRDVEIPSAQEIYGHYSDSATQVPYTGIIYGKYFGPDNNPWGNANTDGVYYIDTHGRDLLISNTCIHGTLIVNARGGKVMLFNNTYMRNYRDDHPTLLVNGELRAGLYGDEFTFNEWRFLDNLRRLLGGRWDDFERMQDRLPNRLDGLIHVTGDCELRGTTTVKGSLICGEDLTIHGDNKVIYDDSLYENPPLGYSTGGKVVPDTCKRVVE